MKEGLPFTVAIWPSVYQILETSMSGNSLGTGFCVSRQDPDALWGEGIAWTAVRVERLS